MLNKTVLMLCCAATFVTAAPLAVSADTPPAKTPAEEHEHDHAQPPAAAKAAQPAVDVQMHRMQELHDKMMAAKTPEERKSLMAEQRKAMQESMAMMKDMKGMQMGMGDKGGSRGMGGMGTGGRHGIMEKRMDMMEMMMQMMMDQQGMGEAPAGK